jgi:hypothetical protein
MIWTWIHNHVIPSDWLRALATVGALVAAIAAWVGSRRGVRRQVVNDLFKEYGSEKVGLAVATLHKEFRRVAKYKGGPVTEAHKNAWAGYYRDTLKLNHRWALHYQRRSVSRFYQRISQFSWGDHFVSRLVRRMWTDTFMLANILLPLETIAIPEARGDPPHRSVEEYPWHWRIVWEF